MKITITDNILDKEDWPIAELRFTTHGTVIGMKLIKEGVYTFPNMRGWTLIDLHNWLRYDPSGKHPEIFNETL